MYPDSGYKRAHAQSVCTRPFSRVGRGLGTRLFGCLLALCGPTMHVATLCVVFRTFFFFFA